MYRNLKDKTKVKHNDFIYNDEFLTMLIGMFSYENLPFRKSLIESLLLMTGSVGIYINYNTNQMECGYCMFTGNIGHYGFGEDVTVITLSNHSMFFSNWEKSSEVAVIFNDSIGAPDLNIDRISKYLSDVDKSIENAILNTRSSKVYRAKDEQEKAALERAIESNRDGRPTAIVSSNILSDLMSSETHEQLVLDLTDPQQVDKIQYLCNLHTSLLRRMQNIYGMTTAGTDKVAQQTIAEVNNGNTFSFVIPLERLNERRKGVERVNHIFKTDISVDFGEAIKREYDRIFKVFDEGEGIIDET